MNPIYNALVFLVWFLATYYSIFFLLSIIANRKKIFENRKEMNENPLVSILVPAFNEEKGIAHTIESLKKLEYKNTEFIILNDGSKDKTSEIVNKNIKNDCRFIFIDNKKNKGKAATLNQGIKIAKGKFIGCMDADSIIEKKILEKTLPYFYERGVGAVTVSVDVKDPKTILHKMIAIEFNLGLSLYLKILSFFNCIFVTPGPFSIYRKSALEQIGGFDINNITEDHEIALRLQKEKFKIKNCIEAKVSTILPLKFKEIYVQRRRWYTGAIQTLFKHKDILFRKKYGFFGFFVPFNNSLIALGLILFCTSTYLGLSKLFENLLYYRYTDFNFLDRLNFNFDILNYGIVNILGISMLIMTISIMLFGLKISKKRYRDNLTGLVTFPFMFFLYQLYWGSAVFNAIRGKKIKWR